MRLASAMTTTDIPTQPVTQPHDVLSRLDHHARAHALAPGDAPPGHYLEVEGDGERRLVALDEPMVHVGRSFTAAVRFDDHTVSRRHAILVRRAGRTRVLDDRSVNGTYVNGVRVEEAVLADGDVIALGAIVLVYREL